MPFPASAARSAVYSSEEQAMDVHINEVSSRVNVTDSQAMLSPQVIQQILRLAREHIREELDHQRRVDAERRLQQGVSETQGE